MDLNQLTQLPNFTITEFEEKYKKVYNFNTNVKKQNTVNYLNQYNGNCILLDKWNTQDYSLGYNDFIHLTPIS